jgi:hypothetical protein
MIVRPIVDGGKSATTELRLARPAGDTCRRTHLSGHPVAVTVVGDDERTVEGDLRDLVERGSSDVPGRDLRDRQE